MIMKENKILIKIKRPISEVFDFVITPTNTSKWIASIVEEKTDKWPVKIGTVYRNKNKDGVWSEYKLTEFKKNKSFTMSQKGTSYRVRYIFKSLGDKLTEMTYFEWVETGDLEDPFSKGTLNNLKKIMEQKKV